jgi:hypothetical protein
VGHDQCSLVGKQVSRSVASRLSLRTTFERVAAHYLTLLLIQGQAIGFLASDPLGDGADLFGTADTQIDTA